MKNTVKIALVAGLSAIVGGLAVYGIASRSQSQSDSDSRNQTEIVSAFGQNVQPSFRTVNLSADSYPDFTYAAESAVDAVVYVKVISEQQSQAAPSDLFEFFFGYDRQPNSRKVAASGSGVIIREDGYIVTNNHVIDNATDIEVTLNNNNTYKARLVGTDPATDVALLKIEETNLPVVKFADSDDLRLGEWVIAIGSPYDLRSTITAGIVSAKGRSMPNYTGEFKIESFIQTDAAVNPGNSGGALVNKKGELVGVNTAIISQTGSFTGYSFAIPSNIVRKIVSDFIEFGSVRRALLGVTISPVTDEIAKEMKLSSVNGVYINEVVKSGAADEAGLKKGDVIIKVGQTVTNTTSALQEAITRFHPGDETDVTIIRDGKKKVVEVEFKGTMKENGTVEKDGTTVFYGSSMKKASPKKLETYGLRHGVEIVSVGPGKIQDAGVREGFIITYVNDIPVETPKDVINVVEKSRRAIYLEGVTSTGRNAYFAFGK